jgi:hypothetical protein
LNVIDETRAVTKENQISRLLLLAIFHVVAVLIADWAMWPKNRDDDELTWQEQA